jgi:uncharacterized membrane protein
VIGRIVLGAVMAGSGVLVVWMARATASGRLGRNQIAGIRLPSTLASDAAWLAAHRRAERPTVWAGLIAIASAVPAVLPVPLEVLLVSVLVGCVAMLAFVLYGAAAGGRAAQAAGEGEQTGR